MPYTILVVEDEAGLRDAISIYLKNAGYQTLQAENGQAGLDLVRSNEVHLAIVDLMMPVMDGLTMIRELQKDYDFPVIILSAKSEEVDIINGLTLGADDYLTKPFSSMELLARVNAAIRRYTRQSHGAPEANLLRCRELELNPETKEVSVAGQLVHLTPKEFMILELLMRNPGRVFSAAEIYESIWKEDAISTETITVHIRKLREKIEENPRKPQYIQVVWGLGYKLRKDAEQ